MDWVKNHKVWSIVIALFIIGATGAALSGDNNNDAEQQTNQEPTIQSAQEEAPVKTPKPDYKFIESKDLTSLRQERHYVWLNEKPSEEQTKTTILKLQKDCPSDKICDLMIWDNENSYRSRNNTSNLSDEYSANNKDHLIGYRNSGGLFYYYGGGETYLSDE